jgi:hypothetical protein
VLAVTADHGQTPIPSTTGGLRIDRVRLEEDIEEYFGVDLVEALHPTELYVDRDELREAGLTLEDVARYVGDYRYGDGLPEGTDTATIPPELRRERVFAGALPGSLVGSLRDRDFDAFGPGAYPEGNLATPPDYNDLLSR